MKRFSRAKFFKGMNLTVFTFAMLFLYIPILILVIYSFNDARIVTSWKGFTLKYYGQLFHNVAIRQAFLNTMLIAVLSTVISRLCSSTSSE